MKKSTLTWIKSLILCLVAGITCTHAEPAQISLAVIQLPEGHDGKIKIKTNGETFKDIQLSSRYFSNPFKISEGTAFAIYNDKDDPATAPPLTQDIQLAEGGRYFGILIHEEVQADQKKPTFKLMLVPITKWPQGSIYVANATAQKIALKYDEKVEVLDANETMFIKAENPARSVPVNIAGADQNDKSRLRLIFSSSWRISPDRREFCFVYLQNNRIRLRSLMERTIP